MARATIAIPMTGLSLGGCGALTVERVLAHVPGVLSAYVNPALETAFIEFDHGRLTPDRLAEAIEGFGYKAGRPWLMSAR